MNYNHLILDIKLEEKIKIKKVKDIFDKIIDVLHLTALNKQEYVFDNGWFTLFYLLAESHISAHYRIEDDYLALDIYSCKNIKDYEKQTINILENLWIKDIKTTKLLRNI